MGKQHYLHLCGRLWDNSCVPGWVLLPQTMKEKDAKGRKGMKRKGRSGDGDDHNEGRGFAVGGLRTGKFQKKGRS